MTIHFVNLLDEIRRRSLRMASMVEDMVQEACETVFQRDEQLSQRVMQRDAEVDSEEVEVEREVIRLMALYQPVGVDLRLLCTILKVNSDLERVADCAVNIAERTRHMVVQGLAERSEDVKAICPMVRRILRNSVQAYSSQDEGAARQVLAEDAAVDAIYAQIVRTVVAAASKSRDELSGYLDLLSIGKNLERIADHAMNIAEDVIFLSTGAIVRHQSTRD